MVYIGIKRGNLLYRDFCWRALFLEANKSLNPGEGGTSLFGIYEYVLYVHRCLSSSSIVHVIGKFGKYSNTVVFLLF